MSVRTASIAISIAPTRNTADYTDVRDAARTGTRQRRSHGHAASVRRALFAALGVLSVALAFVGVFVPGLPTTVFVITASYLFARSSPTLEAWLHRNRWLGPALRSFAETRGMPLRSKLVALASLWVGVSMSLLVLTVGGVALQVAVLAAGMVGTGAILFFVRTTAAAAAHAS